MAVVFGGRKQLQIGRTNKHGSRSDFRASASFEPMKKSRRRLHKASWFEEKKTDCTSRRLY